METNSLFNIPFIDSLNEETYMIFASIINASRVLEKKVKEQENTINIMNQHIDNLHTVVSNLVTGLYNEDTQEKSLKLNYQYLYPEDNYDEDNSITDLSIWGELPTTRQGDENEKRLDIVEEEIKQLKQISAINNLNNFIYDSNADSSELLYLSEEESITSSCSR